VYVCVNVWVCGCGAAVDSRRGIQNILKTGVVVLSNQIMGTRRTRRRQDINGCRG